MKITVLCSDSAHPVVPWLERWKDRHSGNHEIELLHRKSGLSFGDMLFLVSCNEVVSAAERAQYRHSLVLHASDLPRGRGWSPHIWTVLAGADHLTLSLLEAEDKVDTGRIWHQIEIAVPEHALWDEVNEALFEAEIAALDFAIANAGRVRPRPQSDSIEATYFPKRTPADSRIDPDNSIAEQFNLIRICDPNRFPAWFELHGHRYALKVEKISG